MSSTPLPDASSTLSVIGGGLAAGGGNGHHSWYSRPSQDWACKLTYASVLVLRLTRSWVFQRLVRFVHRWQLVCLFHQWRLVRIADRYCVLCCSVEPVRVRFTVGHRHFRLATAWR